MSYIESLYHTLSSLLCSDTSLWDRTQGSCNNMSWFVKRQVKSNVATLGVGKHLYQESYTDIGQPEWKSSVLILND